MRHDGDTSECTIAPAEPCYPRQGQHEYSWRRAESLTEYLLLANGHQRTRFHRRRISLRAQRSAFNHKSIRLESRSSEFAQRCPGSSTSAVLGRATKCVPLSNVKCRGSPLSIFGTMLRAVNEIDRKWPDWSLNLSPWTYGLKPRRMDPCIGIGVALSRLPDFSARDHDLVRRKVSGAILKLLYE
jgi:hypothetical protein